MLCVLHGLRGQLEPLAASTSAFPSTLNACMVGALLCCWPWSHHTHLYKYHVVIPSVWLLSPCLILMEKDIVAM